jgi:hypothetical protein
MQMINSWFRRGGILATVVACSLLVPFTAAQAAPVPVTYSFAGNLDNDPMSEYSISGSFTFNKATSGSSGAYNGAVTDFTFNLSDKGGLVYTSTFTPGANAVTVSNDMPLLFGGMVDRWAMVSAATSNQLLSQGAPSVDYAPFSFDLRFDRLGGGLFDNANLQDPPSLASLGIPGGQGSARWRLYFEDVKGIPVAFVGSITSLTAVPLPAAVFLFGAGLISLVGLGAGGLRNLRGAKA